ncbi:MAG TPA: glycosyltransferase, partial [Leptospiraceae bacterium]|nr:glycosyltransferase [Leptospiraceae bacterium]
MKTKTVKDGRTVLQNILLQDDTERRDLYFKSRGDLILADKGRVILKPESFLSFHSFFNALSIQHYADIFSIKGLFLNFKYAGEGKAVIKGVNEAGIEETISEFSLAFSNSRKPVSFEIMNAEKHKYIFPVFLSESRELLLESMNYSCKSDVENDCRTAIIICTFKKEKYIKKIISILLAESDLRGKIEVTIVDNAKTLSEGWIEKDFIRIIHNRNYGGAGGFTFGAMQYIDRHDVGCITFMDDDIEFEPDIIKRTYNLHSIAKEENYAICGGMLNLKEPTEMFESGAVFDRFQLKFQPLKQLDLRDDQNLKKVFEREEFDYGAFWYFSFPLSYLKRFGLIAPFFIRGDDVEYGFRLRSQGIRLVSVSGIAVWHEPFYAKDAVWLHYYTYRNLLAVSEIYNSGIGLISVITLWKKFFHNSLRFGYIINDSVMNAFEAYMRGPDFLKSISPDKFHFELTQSFLQDKDYRQERISADVKLLRSNGKIWKAV